MATRENLEAEALGVCSVEAFEKYPESTYELGHKRFGN